MIIEKKGIWCVFMIKKLLSIFKKRKIYIKELRPDMTQCRIIMVDKKVK